jgi:hypothetical protein
MTSNNLARIAGISGVLSVLGFVAGAVLSPDPMNPGAQATLLFLLSTLLIAPIFYGLYVFHRPHAQTIALIALILGLIAVVLGLFAPTPTSNPMLFNLSTGLLGVVVLVFGYLGLQNSKMPRVLAIIAIVTGILVLVATALTAVAAAIAETVSFVYIILFVIWALWLSWLFLKGKLI